ncbi:hypothetical protein OIV42_32150, partial [Burkholderia pseudomallei]|nr:hypothetical protein [Burkholderia pseudomallei]
MQHVGLRQLQLLGRVGKREGDDHVEPGVLGGAVLSLVTMPLFVHLSYRILQRLMFAFALVLMFSFSSPFFMLLCTHHSSLSSCSIVLVLCFFFPILYSPPSLLFAIHFPSSLRYIVISLSFHLAFFL